MIYIMRLAELKFPRSEVKGSRLAARVWYWYLETFVFRLTLKGETL